MGGILSVSSYLAALQDFPALELLLVGHPSDEAQVRKLESHHPTRVHHLLRAGLSESDAIQEGMLQLLKRGFPFVGYWGADAEVPLEFALEWQELLGTRPALMAFGSRLRLLQHRHPGHWQRHYAGRILASAVSYVLRMQIYDTECCAKIFKNHELVTDVFATPFQTKLCFNAEIFLRLGQRENANFSVDRDCLEIPVRSWSARTRPRYGVPHLLQRAKDLILLDNRQRGQTP